MTLSQLRTIIGLRWRLTHNQWSRGGQINAVITLIVFVLVLILGAAGGLTGFLVGWLALTTFSPLQVLALWDVLILAFLLFWSIGLISEIQRSETIDMRRLMHLPIGLQQLFVINYLASFACISIALLLPGYLGLSLGLALGKHGALLGAVPLVLSFLFMITAWTYCLRGWLVALMVNPRRRRAVIAGITLSFILLCQLPNLIHFAADTRQRHRYAEQKSAPSTTVDDANQVVTAPSPHHSPQVPPWVLTAHKMVPILWVGNGVHGLAQGHLGPALWSTLGATALGLLGLRRAYFATLGFYLGVASGKRRRRASRPQVTTHRTKLLVARKLPGLADSSAALGLTFLRSNLRAPEIKMMLGTNIIMLFVFGFMFVARSRMNLPDMFKPFIVTGAVVVTFFGMTQLMFNLFGSDRSGFRVLVLCPCARHRILLGKNLAILPLALTLGFALLILCVTFSRLHPVYLLCGLLQLVTAFLMLSMAGNFCSTVMPFRIAAGSLKPTKPPAVIIFLQIVTHLFFPLLVAPVFIPPLIGLLAAKVSAIPAVPINLALSTAVLLPVILGYRLSLPSLGRLLQKREQKILQVVTQAVE